MPRWRSARCAARSKQGTAEKRAGFLAGQVFKFSGFISDEGSLCDDRDAGAYIAIITYWRSFEEHERSHADRVFKSKFSALAELCADSSEFGYDMLWQGEAEPAAADSRAGT
jgi:hypothetical protein